MKLRRFTQFGVALLILAMATPSTADAAKKRTKSAAKTVAATVVKGPTAQYDDALTTQTFSVKKGDSTISVEYPVGGNPTLVNNIRQFIVSSLANWDMYLSITKKQYTNSDIAYYSSLPTPDELLSFIIKRCASKTAFGKNGIVPDNKIAISFSNDKVITVNSSGTAEDGGSWGYYTNQSTTFLISNGKPMTKEMLPSFQSLRPYILNSLANYFDCTISGLNEYIFNLEDFNEYPENSNPYITSEGLCLTYGVGEITANAFGTPTAIIPIATARKLCSGPILEYM